MTGKERVLRTLEFKNPDKLPVDLWVLPGARTKYGGKLEEILAKYDVDIVQAAGPSDHGFTPEFYMEGSYTDLWGCVWTNIQAGIIGEVKEHILADDAALSAYKAPIDAFLKWWTEARPQIDTAIAQARKNGQFVIGGWISLFERMQFLRGTEELYCDIAAKEGNVEKLASTIMDFYRIYVDKWLECDIDAVAFGDDWGSQRSTLVSPKDFRTLFKPLYKELAAKIKSKGKKIFFHSDGYIFDLYDDIIEIGADAINSQLWCMDMDKIARQYAGKVVFWGEMCRQNIFPFGTPEDVYKAARLLQNNFFVNGGGFIGLGTVLHDIPLANLKAMLEAWNE